jgi:UPF0755 protein
MTEETSPLSPAPTPKKVGLLSQLCKSFSSLVRLGIFACVVMVGVLFAPGPLSESKTIVITHGTTTAAISAQLASEHAVYSGLLFHVAAKLMANGSLKAGEYDIPPYTSIVNIVRMMHEGRSVIRMFTIAEGLTSSEVVDALNNNPVLTGTIDAVPAEGSLLPESYRYDYGDSRMAFIARMKKAMQDKLNEVWAGHEGDLPLHTPQDAVVLASIVEKETAKTDERPRIAGVFYNRLRLNMRLQSDPTVIYAITKGRDTLDHALTHEELSYPSPINTYTSDGLPSQPICNPGFAALQAVAHPEHNDYLYFVADGTGGHAFAADLATQNQNINRWHDLMQKTAPQK